VWGPAIGYVGELGIGRASEGIPRTPAGVFGLTQAFGNAANNGTRLPYFRAGPLDWWNGEVGSGQYNTHVHQVRSPGPHSENLYTTGPVYAHAVVIDYNRFPVVQGRGSAFFLHISNGRPTAGCVSLASNLLDQVMRWLDPKQRPVISIGVGAQATALISQQNTAAVRHNPFGYLDTSRAVGSSGVLVEGWAVDPDNRSAVLRIRLFVDGRLAGYYATGVSRPDVATKMRAGPRQGYHFTAAVPRGKRTVCTYADNIGWGTAAVRLGCKPVIVT
jgi:hypothetical protein